MQSVFSRYLSQLLLCVTLSILAGSLIVLIVGENPITVYQSGRMCIALGVWRRKS